MIRLRRTLERGRAHPILGPIIVIVLALILAMLFLHAMQEGQSATTELGSACLAVVTLVWLVLAHLKHERVRARVPSFAHSERGPPATGAFNRRRVVGAAAPPPFPLRR